ncbi:MAG: alpha/beta-hydrolase family protein [Thermoleophilia bacterium]|nr:alpha/beta-hydrolase family protein [Thermoleophilia bacterium]
MTAITAAASHRLPGSTTKAEHQHESWKTGLAVAGLAGIASFQKTLMVRPMAHQAIITAASLAIGFGIGMGADALAAGGEKLTGADQMTSRLALAGVGAVGVLATTIALHGHSNVPLAALRTGFGVIGGGALVGAGLIAEQHAVDAISDRVPGGALGAHAAILGGAAVAAGALMLAAVRPTAVSKAAEAAQAAVRDALPKASTVPPAYDAVFNATVEAQRAGMTTISGKAASSLLPFEGIEAQGQRFLNGVTPRAEIARVMGGAPEELTSPFRIYAGMHQADSHAELVAKMIQEAGSLKNEAGRTALDSGTIIVNIPSGTGYIAPPQVQAAEFVTRGDVTSIGMQYWNKPSIASTGRVPDAAKPVDETIKQLVPAVRARPNGANTKIVVYAESLGSWSVQDALKSGGTHTVEAHGLDLVVNAGTPRPSSFRTEHLGFAGHTTDPTGTITEIDNLTELPAIGTAARDKLKAVLVSHYNDPVTRWTPTQLVAAPPYLTSAENGVGIPRTMKWYPFVTGVQGLFDSTNGASLPKGVLGSSGHDYRGDIMPLFADLLQKPFTKEQATAAIASANQSELRFLAMTLNPTT